MRRLVRLVLPFALVTVTTVMVYHTSARAQPTPTPTPKPVCKGKARILANIRGINARLIDEKSCVQQKSCPDKQHCKVLSEDPDGAGAAPITSWCGCPGDKMPPNECTTLIVPDVDKMKPDHVRCQGTCPGTKKCCPQWVGAEEGGKADRGFCQCDCVEPQRDMCPPSGAPVEGACD